jgi:hypothetical protein
MDCKQTGDHGPGIPVGVRESPEEPRFAICPGCGGVLIAFPGTEQAGALAGVGANNG